MNTSNKNITFKGKPLTLVGQELKLGEYLPPFKLTGNDMNDLTDEILHGQVAIVSVVPSLDTPVCSLQTKHFNQEVSDFKKDLVVLTVSMDLPFAQKRWCGAEGVTRIITASDYKYRAFGEAYGVVIKEWGLLSRAIFVADREGKIVHLEYVPEVSTEPNYEAALKKVKELLKIT
jgi:thioredoxin-dependent peroxiredoxin